MASGIFIFDIIATLALSGLLLFSYGDWFRQRIFVTISVLLAWYFSFLIIFVLPLDISSTTYRQCLANVNKTGLSTSTNTIIHEQDVQHITENEIIKHKVRNSNASSVSKVLQDNLHLQGHDCPPPYSLLDENVLPNLWRVVYWSSQFLTWLILPIMQSFTQAGEFTFSGKLKSALWDNMIYYTSYVLIAIILFIYIAMKPDLHLDWDRTKAIAASASNTWGLFVLVLMLGYGLVEVPRNCWNRSQKGFQLTRAYFRVAKLMSEKSDAEETLDDVLSSVNTIATTIGESDQRRKLVDIIMSKVPLEMVERIKRRRTEVDFGTDAPNDKTLIKLHRQVIKSLQNQHRTEAQWNDWTDYVFELEDINKNLVSNDHTFVHSLSKKSKFWFNPTIEWYWKCLLSPLMLRGAALFSCIMSVLIIWSEVTFFSRSPTLSVFAAFVNLFSRNRDYFAIEITCIITIFYLSLCAYYTIFKIRVLNYYYLAGNHHSDEYTLLFSGALLCRLTPPLCLNFLSMIHMDSHVIKYDMEETAYTNIMGHMDVISIVADYFNVYFPIALLALSSATYFSLGARLLTMLGFQQFLAQDGDVTLELVEEGKEHIKREKRRRQRLAESATRRRDFANRFGDIEANSRDARIRAGEIVKGSRSGSGSPERALLSNEATPMHRVRTPSNPNNDNSSIFTENIDLSSPGFTTANRNIMIEPPRNIFDDI